MLPIAEFSSYGSFDAPVTLTLPLKGAESSKWLSGVPTLLDKRTVLNVISKDHRTMLYYVNEFTKIIHLTLVFQTFFFVIIFNGG